MQVAYNFEKIRKLSQQLRIDVVEMIHEAGSGHPGGALGMADVFATLYYSGLLKFDPHNPTWDERDIVVLSNAHINPVLYAVLASSGYFPKEELMTLRKFGSKLQGHPSRESELPGIETSGGPLGQGMSVAVGFALSLKLKEFLRLKNSDKPTPSPSREGNSERKVFCFCSDGELNEGQSWESIMSAAKFKLNNLIYIIDRNNIQIDGKSDHVMPLEPLHEKLKAFGCHVMDVDGNDINKVYSALKKAIDNPNSKLVNRNSPTALIMHTVPGKGVSFMENNYKWHGKAPNDEEFKKAMEELQGENK